MSYSLKMSVNWKTGEYEMLRVRNFVVYRTQAELYALDGYNYGLGTVELACDSNGIYWLEMVVS